MDYRLSTCRIAVKTAGIANPSRIENMNDEYLTVAEVASMLDVSEDTVRRMFANEPGVINLGHEQKPSNRRYRILRIPRRVLNRVIGERAVQEHSPKGTSAEVIRE
jgi:DeoR/GlpR family transcriptional regulator of sugar metabolism